MQALHDELRELRESRDRYRALFQLAPVPYLTLDGSGRIRNANRAAIDLLGVDGSELVDVPLAHFLSAEDSERFEQYKQRVVDVSEPQRCDLRLRTDARVVPVRLESLVLPEPVVDGARWLCVALQSRSGAILGASPDATIGIDAEGRIEQFNPAAERMFGRSRAEVLGRNVSLLMPSPHREAHDGYIAHYLSSGEPRVIGRTSKRLEGSRADGSVFPCELSLGEWFERGERRFTGFVRDLTAQVEAEERLRASEVLFRQLAEQTGDAYLLRERTGEISYASPSCERIWGLSPAELREDPDRILDVLHPEDRERAEVLRERALAGEPLEDVGRVVRPGGGVRWILARWVPVRDENGAWIRTIIAAQDVTARRRMEEELRQAQKLEALGALSSGVAHDFGNLLQGILGLASVASREGVRPERAQEANRRILEAVERGRGLVRQLLRYSRREERRGTTLPVPIDALIAASSDLVGRLVGDHIRVEVVTGAPGAHVLADPVQIDQIIMNLASNARDAMPDGGVLTLETDRAELGEGDRGPLAPGAYVRLRVEDTGCGMDGATAARAFDPFFTTKAPGVGTGLGLSTVREVVASLGGDIELESAIGGGTTLTILLPACGSERSAPPGERLQGFTGRVLLVEDDPIARTGVRTFLEDLGFAVEEASSPEEAIRMARTGVDLMVSDVTMPGMNGPALATVICESAPGLPVLFVSALPLADLVERGVLRADVHFLQKPFDTEELAAALQEALEDRSAEQGA